MSLNRVIGANNRLPWHLPEDFKWFKRLTTGHVLVMGRKTFESIGKPLPKRTTLVLSRSGRSLPGVQTISTVEGLIRLSAEPVYAGRHFFVCGGAELYRHLLPLCSELYLTLVKREVQGDTFFPAFEDQFEIRAELQDNADFKVLHYLRKSAQL